MCSLGGPTCTPKDTPKTTKGRWHAISGLFFSTNPMSSAFWTSLAKNAHPEFVHVICSRCALMDMSSAVYPLQKHCTYVHVICHSYNKRQLMTHNEVKTRKHKNNHKSQEQFSNNDEAWNRKIRNKLLAQKQETQERSQELATATAASGTATASTTTSQKWQTQGMAVSQWQDASFAPKKTTGLPPLSAGVRCLPLAVAHRSAYFHPESTLNGL